MPMGKTIGIFDSGVGGLTVALEIHRLMPWARIIYLGDNANAPYGGKDKDTLLKYGRDNIGFLLSKGAEAVVIACGTSSSTTYANLKDEFSGIPVLDTITPGVDATARFARDFPGARIVFAATDATVGSGLFTKLMTEAGTGASIYERTCPMLAPMAEAGLHVSDSSPLVDFVIENYLGDLRGGVDALVLGCTHYPLFTSAFERLFGEIEIIDPAKSTAKAASKLIFHEESTKALPEQPLTIYTNGPTEFFLKKAENILNKFNSHEIFPM